MRHGGLEGLDTLLCRVARNPNYDRRGRAEHGPDHEALWRRADSEITVLELAAAWGMAGAPRAIEVLEDLSRWGAITLLEPKRRAASPAAQPAGAAGSNKPYELIDAAPTRISAAPDEDIPIVEDPDHGVPIRDGVDEAELLAEDVEIEPGDRQRILRAARLLREGRVLDLLGVERGVDRTELKRAYYALSKDFHPDRYYGRRLGSYARILTGIFEATSQAVKTLIDARTVAPRAPAYAHRRAAPRFSYHAPVRLRCESWTEVQRTATREIGAGGMFVATPHDAREGERVELELTLPNMGLLPLRGKVVARVPQGKRGAGLCIQLDPLGESDRLRFGTLLQAAKQAEPAPAETTVGAAMGKVRLARGSGSVRTVTPIIGIDLGTTFVSVAAAVGGRVHVLPWSDGMRAMSSVVAFPRRGEVLVGAPARERLARDPKHAVASAKRLLGRKQDDKELEGFLAQSAFETAAGPGGDVLVDMWGEAVAIPQLCGYLLDAARSTAERALGQPVSTAVLTAPVSFGAERIELLKRAARLAHLDVLDVIDEPSAAALANRFRPDFGGIVGVYDFGGGTFDFSVVDATGGDFRVLATAGDSWLGGDDFDLAVAEALANQFWRVYGVDVRQRVVEWQDLLFACERAKRDLSRADETQVHVPEVMRTKNGPVDLRARVVRHAAERLWRPLIERSFNTCLQTLALVGLTPADLTAIYLSGGTTYIPAVRRGLADYFGVPVRTGVPPDFAVCLGAGIHAAQLAQLQEPTLPIR